jgi:hypothetical protein
MESKEIIYARVKVGDKILDQVLNQSVKGRKEWSIYIKQRKEGELKLIKECFG